MTGKLVCFFLAEINANILKVILFLLIRYYFGKYLERLNSLIDTYLGETGRIVQLNYLPNSVRIRCPNILLWSCRHGEGSSDSLFKQNEILIYHINLSREDAFLDSVLCVKVLKCGLYLNTVSRQSCDVCTSVNFWTNRNLCCNVVMNMTWILYVRFFIGHIIQC